MCSSFYNKSKDLNDTKWICDFGDGYISYFLFKDIEYVFYNAENGDTTFGTYILKNDTIIFNQKYGSFDYEFTENSHHRAGEGKYKMIIKNKNQLGFIEQWDYNSQIWIDSFYFKKISR